MKNIEAGTIDSQKAQQRAGTGSWLAFIDDPPKPALISFLITVAVMLLYRQLNQPEGGDSAIWDYVAQCIVRGQIPYRDVIEIKTPGSAYLSAIAMWIGSWVGVRDLVAVRLMQTALVGLLSATTYLVAREYLGSRAAAFIAFTIPLMFAYFVGWMLAGTQPKLSMTLFGMVTMLLIARDKPLWAGVCSMLSCLCWQPGLLFTGTAVLIFSRYLTSWRDGRGLQVIAGAAVPLILAALYYYSAGAFKGFWTWTVTYNYNLYAPHGVKDISEQLSHIWRVLWRVLGNGIVVIFIALAGLILFSVERVAVKLTGEGLRSPNLYKDGLIIAPAVYLLFCLIDFQAGPDLIPLFPFIAIFAAWFVVKTGRWLLSSTLNKQGVLGSPFFAARRPVIVIAMVITLACAASDKPQSVTLQDQYREYQTLSNMLGPDDKIYAHGSVEILALLNRPNMNPYIMWDKGKDIYIAAERYGGSFDAIIAEIEAEHPKLISVARLNEVSMRLQLERWIADHYDKLEGYNNKVYLRRQSNALTFPLLPRILDRERRSSD